MAQQLLQSRSAQAYAGVEAYARNHQKDGAGPLAWLVIGYARYLDKDYSKALAAWQHSNELAPVLGDYLDYLRAGAQHGQEDHAAVIKTLEGFDQRYPDSLFIRDSGILYAQALIATGEPQRAAVYLEKHRQPLHSDVELTLAHAYRSAGQNGKAAEVLRRIYFEEPLAGEAESAAMELRNLGEVPPSGSFEQHHARAGILMKGKRYSQVVSELTLLVEQAPPPALHSIQLEFATALYRERKRDDAQRLFETVLKSADADADSRAQSLYFLAEIARDKDDRDKNADFIAQLRTVAPQSTWFQQGLLSAGNMYLLKKEYDKAVRAYSEVYDRERNGRFSPYAHWKSAWLSYRMGKMDDAKRLFEEQLTLYPSSNEAPAALYWRGRLAEADGDQPLARAYYQKLSENYRYYYYANLGRQRLTRIGLTNVGDPPLLDKLPAPSVPPRNWDAPEDNLRVKKAQLLANAALYDFAERELQAAVSGAPSWQAASEAQLYADAGSYNMTIETLKRAVPGYFSSDLNQIPHPVWQGLFPRPYWEDLKKNAVLNQLDPYLVASLIRQESEFNAAALSHANAMGLMQLLPQVGKGMAKEEKIKHFSTDELFVANINLQLGTRYFKHMVDHYHGQLEYALAAYNAGEDRVDEWRSSGDFKDVEEFVESIPFTETREYVQAIMRNAVLYKLLYPSS
ncbi:MAG TPA: transglycosylase SLT domain-containing protein [Candidatus Angelobacter sp.]|nr:transglycosylase SLT domain-containing protein [Candidatus Angelobacter sp.]